MPFCTNCGHDNPDGSNFCSQCGAALNVLPAHSTPPAAGARPEAAVDALPTGSALLIVQRGANAGSRFLLNTESSTVGRHPDSDIFLDDISVSRRHAEFLRRPEGTVVRDAGSLNGTYVNRRLVDEVLLQHGDEVQIGKFRLVFYGSAQG